MTKAQIQAIRALHSKHGREQSGQFICEGAKIIGEIMESELRIYKIFALRDNPKYERVTSDEMARISALKTPSDMLAVVEIPQYDISKEREGLKLVLDGVQDPGNLGTIIRIADWFGIENIYCSKGSADCFNPKVVQATMGAIGRVKVHYTDIVSLLQNTQNPVYGTFLDGMIIYETPLSGDGYIVMGSEGRGISEAVSELVTDRLYIPSFAKDDRVESLNVAVATSITCSEFRRRAL